MATPKPQSSATTFALGLTARRSFVATINSPVALSTYPTILTTIDPFRTRQLANLSGEFGTLFLILTAGLRSATVSFAPLAWAAIEVSAAQSRAYCDGLPLEPGETLTASPSIDRSVSDGLTGLMLSSRVQKAGSNRSGPILCLCSRDDPSAGLTSVTEW